MKAFRSFAFAAVALCAAPVLAQINQADSEQAVVQADRALETALGRGDWDSAERMLHPEFSWITEDGIMWPKREAREAGLKPLVGTGSDVKVLVHRYGKALYVERSKDEKQFAMHVWAEEPQGLRLLHINEIQVREPDYTPVRPDYDVPCINICQVIPFVPLTANQKAALEGWQEQEQGPDRSGWNKRVADNYDQRAINTYAGRSPSKADRIAARNRRMRENPDAPYVSAVPVLWSRWWDIGDDAVFMISLQPTYGEKAYWASRIFARIDGLWQMAESYHTFIEASPVMTAVPISESMDPRAR
jgi:hypothetical protein